MHPTFTSTYLNTSSAARILFTLPLLVLPLLGLGQTFTGTYPFTNVTSSTGTTDPTSVPTATGVAFGPFAAVGTPANPSAGSRFSFTGWPTGALDGSDTFTGLVDAGKYYTVTLTPQAGFVLSLSNITFTLQRTSTGVRQYVVRSSADNYTANLPASTSSANTSLSVVAGNIFQVADAATTAQTGSTVTLGGAGYTNVSGPVTFRFYGFNAEAASSGTFSIDDVKITGTATAINAPAISSFTPASGPVGTSVTISGTYFTASTSVAFNGVAATNVVITNATTLTATVPSGATSGAISVSTSGGTATSATLYTVTVPTVVVNPTSLPGFAAAAGATSAVQTYQVSGSSLDGNILAINASTPNFEVSLDGRSYGSSASIALGGSPTLAATTIYVRLAGGAPLGSATGTIAHTNGTVTTNLSVSGVVVAPLAAKRWTGAAGTSSWFDAANWENGTVPASTDDVVLDHRYVTGKYTVALGNSATVSPSPVTVSSLRIRPAAGDSILCVIPPSNTISTGTNNALALALSRTVVGDTALYIATKGAFINTSGATTTGDVFDPAGSSPTVFLLNGGSFYHRTARSSTPLVENLSGAAGTETGNFFFRIPGSSTTISGSARTYGNLIFQRGGASSYGTSGTNIFTINGTLTIESGVTFIVTINGTMVLKGNLANAGNFQLKAASATATGRRLVLQGTAPQVLVGTPVGDPASATSYLGPDAQLEINNAAGVTLQTPLTLSNALVLNNGWLTTSTVNVLTMLPTATVTGGSGSSFVNGPVARSIPSVANGANVYTSYTFPVGKGNTYRPLTLNINTQASTTTYRAEQFEGDPGQNVAGSDLARVSAVRWVTITPFSGTTVAQPSGFAGTLTMPIGPTDGITDLAATSLVLAKRTNATQPWSNIGRSATTGTAASGTLTSGIFTSFSDFAVASTSVDATANPLPVTLVNFGTVRQANGTVKLAWATASEQRSAYFEVQRSLDGRTFATIAKLAAHGTTTQAHTYTSLDASAPDAMLYYRLHQVDIDGKESFSPVSLLATATTLALYPNPTHDYLTIANGAGAQVQVADLTGRVLQTTTLPASGQLGVQALPAGTYLLRVSLGGKPHRLRFTKQ